MSEKSLLFVDGLLNLGIGLIVVGLPVSALNALGVPGGEPGFYRTVLGATLAGIGVALLLECFQPGRSQPGLGLQGAVVINVPVGLALGIWLIVGDLALPLRGRLVLWGLAALALGLSVLEWKVVAGSRTR